MMSPSWSASRITVLRLTTAGTSVCPECVSVFARIIVLPSGSVSIKACANIAVSPFRR
jgi:hypothetical protein